MGFSESFDPTKAQAYFYKVDRIKAQETIENLRTEIRLHDYQYYVLDKPQITDYQYDKKFAELQKLEQDWAHELPIPDDSPTQRVGGAPVEKFEKIPHRLPMLSLQNSYNAEDILAFAERVQKLIPEEKLHFYCEPKLDGLAMELIYENGSLVAALTRGDGAIGENVFSNIKTIPSIPLRLQSKNPPALLEVRGEVLILKKDFLTLNEQQQEAGEEPFSNPRNAAAGTVRQLDSKIATSRRLHFFAYAIGAVEGLAFSSQENLQSQLSEFGFVTAGKSSLAELQKNAEAFSSAVSEKAFQLGKKLERQIACLCKTAQEAVLYYNTVLLLRSFLPYDIDGIVIKINSFAQQKTLGFVARSPRWANAAKFQPEQAITQIKEIRVQVGRTGALTPVAIMQPVEVGGVTVTHATLHNQDEIDRKDIREGDWVRVQRAGDVIPEVVEVLLDKRTLHAQSFLLPKDCPSCAQPVARAEGEVVLRCYNPICPAKIKESLKHFVSRRAMNVEKVGDKLIEQLVDAGLVTSFSDLFALTKKQLLSLERQGEKSSDNILKSIAGAKSPGLAAFIFSLGIRFVGEQTAKTLAEHYPDLRQLFNVQQEALLELDDVGPKVAQSITSAFSQKKLQKEIEKLFSLGVLPRVTNRQKLVGKPVFAEMTFVITGTLPLPRDKVKELIESYGGECLSAVSKKTSVVLAGEEAGSKLERARELNVAVWDWTELEKQIQKGS